MTRSYYHSETIEESNYGYGTDVNYQDKTSLSFTPGDNETWLIIATWQLNNLAGGSQPAKAKLIRTSGTPATFAEHILYVHDNTDYPTGCCFAIDEFGSSPGEQTYKIQYATGSTSYAVYIKEVKITAIRIEANDKFNYSTGRDTYNTNTNWQDKVALTFTPPSTGDYLILSSCIFDCSATSYDVKLQIDLDGSTQYDVSNIEYGNAAGRSPWGIVKKLTLTNASHTIKLQYATEHTFNTVGISSAYIIALRLDGFINSYYSETETRTTSTATSYQDFVTLTQTLAGSDYLVLSSCGADENASLLDKSSYHQLIQGTTSLGEMPKEPQDYSTRHFPYVNSKFLTSPGQSYTWKLQYHAEDGSDTAGIQDGRIVVLQLGETLLIPTVTTSAATDILQNSATGNGQVVSDGGSTISERGFVWSNSTNPTIDDNKVIVSGTTGVFNGSLTGLSAYTIYHYRAYAINDIGIGYGEDRSFTTLSILYTEFEEMEERTFSKPIVIITLGSFEVPQYDIIDLDQLTLSRADDFSVVTSDITITLNNNTGKYTPSRTNFIWAGESWYHQYFKLEFTYQDISEKYLLFEGYITKWNQKNTKDPAYDSQVDGQFVEVTAEDHCSMLEERMIGVPDDEGLPNPFVHGHIFRQAETLGPDVFWTANESIGYETGDLTEVDSVTGTGTTVITVDPYDGIYCAQHQDNAASAFCKQDVAPAGTDEFHVSAMIKFTAIPEVPLFNTLWFMGIYTTGNLNSINVNINTDGTTHDLIGINMAGFGNVLSRISVSDYLDRWFKLDLITRNDLPNQQMVVRLYLNGDDILTFVGSGSYPANNYRYAYWGLNFNSVVQSGWALCTDQIKCYTVAYPYGYYLPGGAYQEISGIYVDGAFWPRKNKAHWNPYWNDGRFQFSYISYTGKGTLPENYRTNLNYCLVDFLDFDKEPNGSIIIDAIKDNINHPVDQIQAILEAVDLDSRIDTTNFVLAKSLTPDDTVGVYIDNQSAADGITSICQNTMNSFVERQGEFCIFPFTGQHMVDYERSLVESKYHSIEQATDMDNIKTKVDVTWGWYDNDKHLFYRIKNEDMIAIVGNQEAKLDLSYGQDVSSNNADMAKIKAGLLLNRYSGPIDEVIIKGNLSFIRIEIGDGVLIHSDFYETELIYEVIEKVIDFNDKTVELRCHRYLGNGIGQVFMGSSTIAPFVLIIGDSTFTGDIAYCGEETSIGSIRTNVDYAYLPYYSKARGSTVNPTFIYGNINYTPTQAESIGSSIDPIVAIS